MKETYNVRVYKTAVYKGTKVTTYYVRWKVDNREWKEPFRTGAQADSFRSELLAAARKGEAFGKETGRPSAWARHQPGQSWYEFACAYTAAKWPYAAPNHRRGIAEALTDVTEVLISGDARPSRDDLRTALREWTFSDLIRQGTVPPEDLQSVIHWLEKNTVMLADLSGPDGPALARRMLERISQKVDGGMAAPNTANRKRMVLNNAMEYACEIGALSANPLKQVKWTKPRTLRTVDPRVVINPDQARRFLDAVHAQGPRGERLVAFFGCMYYAALRPEEVIDLRRDHLVSLPTAGWGEMRLTHSEPRSGTRWTESGKSRERRALKHRPAGETRSVPIHPELVALLRNHQEQYPAIRDRRLFTGPRGGIVAEWTYLEVFHAARQAAHTEAEATTPLMGRPYDLRHAAVSTWLNAGVPAPQVAEWAGHSVDVLLRVYAKCIAGQQTEAKRRIEEATRPRKTTQPGCEVDDESQDA
jgi:integrase